MKHFLLILAALLPLSLAAQESVVIEDRFDGSSQLEWEEFALKNGSALIQNDGLFLRPLKKGVLVLCKTELPISLKNDFSVECTVFLPKLDDKYFGMDLLGVVGMSVSEGHANAAAANNRVMPESKKIKLLGGKNKTVVIGIKQSAGKYIFTVNNMTFSEFTLNTEDSKVYLGVWSKTPAYVKAVKIEQK